MRMLYEVNRLLLTQGQRFHIEQMIKAFEACYKMGKRPYHENMFLCYRLERLRKSGVISDQQQNHCRQLVMRALDGCATLNLWWVVRNPNNHTSEMPNHYRQLWLKQIIKDLRWLLA